MRCRSAEPSDYAVFARLFLELQVDEPVAEEAAWAGMSRDTILLEEGGEVAGYGHFRVYQGVGAVVHLVTAPGFRRRGLGRRLMEEMAARLRATGCQEWFLNVKPDNAAAIALYESLGMRPGHRSVQLQFDWTDVARLPLTPLESVEPEEDAFGLVPGQLANLRARGYVIVCLGRSQEPLAFAGFDPALPGAHPFRMRSPEYARALLEGLRKHARHPYLRVVVENDLELSSALRAIGAREKLEILQMRGPLQN